MVTPLSPLPWSWSMKCAPRIGQVHNEPGGPQGDAIA